MTFILVLMVTSIKEGVEDLDRANSDKRENIRKVTIVTFSPDGSTTELIKETQEVILQLQLLSDDILSLNICFNRLSLEISLS